MLGGESIPFRAERLIFYLQYFDQLGVSKCIGSSPMQKEASLVKVKRPGLWVQT